MVLPIILHQCTPTVVFATGVGAIAAAAMSSADSFLLSTATIFTTHIYQSIRTRVRELRRVFTRAALRGFLLQM